jgi:3D (Asp-Asp-Asp) domain-containing protein
MTKGRRHVWLGMLLLTVSACSHRIQPAPPPQAPARVAAPLLFTATAYCTGRITASGVPVSRGVAAADPAVLPLGTVIRVTGAASYDGTYRVLDTGALVRRRHVDLYIPDCPAARRFGRRSVQVEVIRTRP